MDKTEEAKTTAPSSVQKPVAPAKYAMEDIKKLKKAIYSWTTLGDRGSLTGGIDVDSRALGVTIDDLNKIRFDKEEDWRKVSRAFYNHPVYKRTIDYLATLYFNHYMIIPQTQTGKKPNKNKLLKDYHTTLNTLDETFQVEAFTKECLLDMLIEGQSFYYLEEYKQRGAVHFKPVKMPTDYCKIIGTSGVPAINVYAVNLMFLDKIVAGMSKITTSTKEIEIKNLLDRDEILSRYPKNIREAYKSYKLGKRSSSWYVVPTKNGMAFTAKGGFPPFAPLAKELARIVKFEFLRDDYIETNLTKLLIQYIDVDKEGNPEVDLTLAAEFHKNLKDVASKKGNIDALTTLAKEIEILSLGDTGDQSKTYDFIKTFYTQFYADAGISEELFNSTTKGTLEFSLTKDEAFMSSLREQVQNWFNYFLKNINYKKVSKNTIFVFLYLDTSYNNREKMIDGYLEGAQYGYSKLMPQIAMGVRQSYIDPLLNLENDILDLGEKLVPLQSSHTMSSESNSGETGTDGRPVLADKDKEDTTITKDGSL